MASQHSSLELTLHEMTLTITNSGLVPNPPPSTSYVPPSRTDWDIFLQLLFGELINPPPSVDPPTPKVIASTAKVVAPEPDASTGLPSSTTIDQDAPSASNSQTTTETQSLVICNDFEEENHNLNVAHMNNDPQPDGFMDKEDSNHVYKLKKALYSLKQAPYVWYDLLLKFLLSQEFSKGTMDPTLFIKREGKDILLVQIYVEDIIFASTTPELDFTKSKYGMKSRNPVDTPMVKKSKLDKDPQAKVVDPTHYHIMVGTLMYLTASRPDLTFAVCMCAPYHAKPT
nr:hypothetical protein [Tanacetum cinerariifolium]